MKKLLKVKYMTSGGISKFSYKCFAENIDDIEKDNIVVVKNNFGMNLGIVTEVKEADVAVSLANYGKVLCVVPDDEDELEL